MSLNKKLMSEYKFTTGLSATYKKGASTFHFLKYVDWLEDRLLKTVEAQNSTSTNNVQDSISLVEKAISDIEWGGMKKGSAVVFESLNAVIAKLKSMQ